MEDMQIQQEEDAGETVTPGALTPRQERVRQALLLYLTYREAARAAGVSETTVWRYMNDNAFRGALNEVRRGALAQLLTHLHAASVEAVAVLREVMLDKNGPAPARVSASRASLDFYLRADQTEELLRHVDELTKFIRKKQEEDELDAALRREKEE